ncbi:acetyl-CoA carboxylase biotin carboxyl carrier protein [Erythrobacter arachoides]|uniref:Biotin carboxyl carrier protein of acetyl-CoA carboxylase n=2 Tax=Aurantiacibacter arachoides TaxID=1850444 RepID=A0A844ZZH0_9SPHN|nr:acetyl-CoA carboxylase biotin carboxyl carrier protein [Aurantiacibacter arachoides]
MSVDSDLVRELAEMLAETGLTEIEVEDGDRRIRVSRGGLPAAAPAQALYAAAPAVAPAPAAPAAPAAAGAAENVPAADNANTVKSPMVGTCYLAPEPSAGNFVAVGDSVKKGDTLLIVEAMKVMNPIVSPRDGTVQQLLVDNGDPVEFDQPLAVVS